MEDLGGLGRGLPAREAADLEVYNELILLIGHFLLGSFVG